jgi:hypothetical protein
MNPVPPLRRARYPKPGGGETGATRLAGFEKFPMKVAARRKIPMAPKLRYDFKLSSANR